LEQPIQSIARKVGTTVSLTNIFFSLPVRLKEFQKNKKREFLKTLKLIQSYALINEGVSFSCSNANRNGNSKNGNSKNGNSNKNQFLIKTNGKFIKENFISIFGSKQYKDLIEIEDSNDNFKINGIISKNNTNSGKNNKERQFIFFNKSF
jgi:DNA mismatch repair protein PMS2